jgi:hypothetical protein
MIDLTFAEYLNEKRGAFHTYFFWPVYRNRNGASRKVEFGRLEGHFFKLSTNEVFVPNREMVNFGPDFIYQEFSDDFGVAFGTFARKGPRDIANSIRILERLGLVPIRFEKTVLFEFLKEPLNYANYRLREYRGKAERLQSYFKDDMWNYGRAENSILKRLTEDARMGIKPYQASFRSIEGNGNVKVFESGALLTDKPQKNIGFIADIMEKVITQGKGTVALAKNVKVEHLKKAISLRLHTDMVIEIEETNSNAVESFIRSLDMYTGIYGIWRENNQHFMNIQYEKKTDGTMEITSAFSVSIEPTSIIATPTIEPALEDTLSLFYDVDRHFKIKQGKGVSAR